MITKDQAMTFKNFLQVKELKGVIKLQHGTMQKIFVSNGETTDLEKPFKWRANGKCQTWKTRPNDFKLPIKYGMYGYAYLTPENAHLFELDL